MYGQGTHGIGGRRDFSTRMGEQQDSDPQQDHRNEQPVSQPPQVSQCASSGGVIQPDLEKREKLIAMARKEEEDYQRFKESRRSGPIHLTPRKVGGDKSESEARLQQQRAQAQSKYQKMMQREEYKRKQKEEEEAKIQEMKDIQRRKAEKLEQKRQQQDLERKERWHDDRCIRNNEFLDQFQPINHPYHRDFGQPSEWRKIEEQTRLQEMKRPQHKKPTQQTYRQQQKEEEEKRLKEMKDEQRRQAEVLREHEEERRLSQEEERRRVNKAFLDRLQGRNTSQHGYSGESNTWA